MQDDGSTVDITIGENVNVKNVSVDDNYMEYLMDNINNDSDGMDSTIEYDDMEVEDLYLDWGRKKMQKSENNCVLLTPAVVYLDIKYDSFSIN